MPTAEDHEHKEPSKHWLWVFHHPLLMVLATTSLDVLSTVVHMLYNSGLLAVSLSVIALVPYFLLATSSAFHGRTFCDRCVEEHPLDGEAEAQKHLRSLKIAHLIFRKKIVFVCLALFVAYGFFKPDGPQYTILGTLFFWPLLGMEYRILGQHVRLSPWCPFCKGFRDDEDEEPVVVPPVPSGKISA